MNYTIEKRSGVDVLVYETGSRPASDVEVELMEELNNMKAEIATKDAIIEGLNEQAECCNCHIGLEQQIAALQLYHDATIGKESERERQIAAKDAELADLRDEYNKLQKSRDRALKDWASARENLQDWLNFSIDIYTSDAPGMEWLISLKKKTGEMIAQAALKEGK